MEEEGKGPKAGAMALFSQVVLGERTGQAPGLGEGKGSLEVVIVAKLQGSEKGITTVEKISSRKLLSLQAENEKLDWRDITCT